MRVRFRVTGKDFQEINARAVTQLVNFSGLPESTFDPRRQDSVHITIDAVPSAMANDGSVLAWMAEVSADV
jgi:hypothetical protein